LKTGKAIDNTIDRATGYLETPVGILRISATSQAISEIMFTNHAALPAAKPVSDAASDLIIECCNQLNRYFIGNLRTFSFTIEQPGTAFQQKVWQQLSVIPYGETISYLTLAKRLGDVKVIRAAASANGRNNLSIVTPCHRVIGTSGELVGYAGGLWRKKWLLAHEMKHAHGVRTLF
jgi:methylated-DNA-[protein]-cysteine S-methyltransferase